MIIWWPELSQASLSSKSHVSYRAASPQLLIWMSVFYVSLRSLINPAGFKGFAAICDCPCLHEGLTANCAGLSKCVKSAPADASKRIHSHVYDAILLHGPGTSEIPNNWRSQDIQTNSLGSQTACKCLLEIRSCSASDSSGLWLRLVRSVHTSWSNSVAWYSRHASRNVTDLEGSTVM